jgi:hypothetical protein
MKIVKQLKVAKSWKERGVSLPISLFILIGVLLSATILLRSGDITMSIAGNVGSKANVSNSNDSAIGQSIVWVSSLSSSSRDSDDINGGYYSAYSETDIDYTLDTNWTYKKTLEADGFGNISYVQVRRMCKLPNTAYNGSANGVSNECALSDGSGTSGNTSAVGYNSYNFSADYTGNKLFYKIIVKTVGGKGAMVITETVISL